MKEIMDVLERLIKAVVSTRYCFSGVEPFAQEIMELRYQIAREVWDEYLKDPTDVDFRKDPISIWIDWLDKQEDK